MAQYNMLSLSLIDPLHNGSGEGLGLVDRPIMRERTTQFPIIQSTSIKGVLRDLWPEKGDVPIIFGPDHRQAESHAGATAFGEGQLLAFPVRSLRGHLAWTTSLLTLCRFREKARLAGVDFKGLVSLIEQLLKENPPCPVIADTSLNELLVSQDPKIQKPENGKLVLEEYSYKVMGWKEAGEFSGDLAKKLFSGGEELYLQEGLSKKLVVLPEETFRYFITHATEVTPNIRISDKGVTDEGSLRYTEYLPRDSVLYSLVIHERAKTPKDGPRLSDAEVKIKFEEGIKKLPQVQIGGDETTGKGQARLRLLARG